MIRESELEKVIQDGGKSPAPNVRVEPTDPSDPESALPITADYSSIRSATWKQRRKRLRRLDD